MIGKWPVKNIKIMIIIVAILNFLCLAFEAFNYAFRIVDFGMMIIIYRGITMVNCVLLAGMLGETVRNKGRIGKPDN